MGEELETLFKVLLLGIWKHTSWNERVWIVVCGLGLLVLFQLALPIIISLISRLLEHIHALEAAIQQKVRSIRVRVASRIRLANTAMVPAVLVLILAASGSWPHNFYILTRIVVCVSCVFLALSLPGQLRIWRFSLVLSALLFNPVAPFHFARDTWRILNILGAIGIAPAIFLDLAEKSLMIADERKRIQALESLAITAERWLLEGRQFYDLADVREWNPSKAATCFENGLRANPANTDLHVYLGMLYEDGDGVQQDYQKAIHHFNVAAVLGDPNAQRKLGEMYDEGRGLAQNSGTAASWYQRAADQGDTYAQCRLGVFYSTGIAFTRDLKQALGWYLKAAKGGEAAAQVALGEMYELGAAVNRDLAQAAYWYCQAAARRDENGQTAKKALSRLAKSIS